MSGERWYWKEASRSEWSHPNGQPTVPYDFAAIGIGCLRRIATALETLVRRSDPATIAYEEKQDNRKKRWSVCVPHLEFVNAARLRALDRLLAGTKTPSDIRIHVGATLRRGEPALPYSYWDDTPISSEILERWSVDAVAYFDAIHELPQRIAKDGTKKQARYLEWLASLNGKLEKSNGG